MQTRLAKLLFSSTVQRERDLTLFYPIITRFSTTKGFGSTNKQHNHVWALESDNPQGDDSMCTGGTRATITGTVEIQCRALTSYFASSSLDQTAQLIISSKKKKKKGVRERLTAASE